MPNIEVSIIITIYNKFDFLELVLAGFEIQSFKNFEIILADDGSSPDVVEKIKNRIAKSSIPITHVWHEDEGWRKNIILNKAILKSNSGYLIFVDGDCIPHKHFVKEHVFNKQNNVVLAGRRLYLSKRITLLLTEEKVRKGLLYNYFFIYSVILRIFGHGNHIENGLYIKSKLIRRFINRKERGIKGSNFSIHKSDILDIILLLKELQKGRKVTLKDKNVKPLLENCLVTYEDLLNREINKKFAINKIRDLLLKGLRERNNESN